MRVDRLEVHLARVEEVRVGEIRVLLERRLQSDAHGVLDEARLQVRMFDDEELVRPLQQLVDRRAHRALHDVGQLLRVDGLRGADVERAAAALVVRREWDELENPLDVARFESGLEQALGRAAPYEALRARAGVDAERLDADDAPDAVARRGRDADQRDELLRREAGHGRLPPARVARLDPHLGPQRRLARDDMARDVLRELLDEERFADHDLFDRLFEEFRKA